MRGIFIFHKVFRINIFPHFFHFEKSNWLKFVSINTKELNSKKKKENSIIRFFLLTIVCKFQTKSHIVENIFFSLRLCMKRKICTLFLICIQQRSFHVIQKGSTVRHNQYNKGTFLFLFVCLGFYVASYGDIITTGDFFYLYSALMVIQH